MGEYECFQLVNHHGGDVNQWKIRDRDMRIPSHFMVVGNGELARRITEALNNGNIILHQDYSYSEPLPEIVEPIIIDLAIDSEI